MYVNLNEKANLFDVLDGLFAYDCGYTDSGISDPLLKSAVKKHLDEVGEGQRRYLLAEFMIEYFLGPQGLERGCGPEDALCFLRWAEDESIV